MGDLTVLLGGARSGKSALSVELGRRHVARGGGDVVYVATAPALDDDMERRIERHRAERPPSWRTIEEQTDLVDALDRAVGDHAAPTTLVIIDCLTLWTSNLLWRDHTDDEVGRLADATASHAAAHPGRVVAISNEVGLGVHPETALGRRYRDVLGRVNQAWVAAAETSLLLVAGRALRLDDPWTLLDVAPGRPVR